MTKEEKIQEKLMLQSYRRQAITRSCFGELRVSTEDYVYLIDRLCHAIDVVVELEDKCKQQTKTYEKHLDMYNEQMKEMADKLEDIVEDAKKHWCINAKHCGYRM